MDLVNTLWGSQLVTNKFSLPAFFWLGDNILLLLPFKNSIATLHRSSLDVCEEMVELLVTKGSSDCLLRELYQKAGILMQIMTT